MNVKQIGPNQTILTLNNGESATLKPQSFFEVLV